MAERSFYCPCDDFNLFDNTNYDLELQRQHYCKVPMAECIERYRFLFIIIFFQYSLLKIKLENMALKTQLVKLT